MSDEKKISIDELEGLVEEEQGTSWFSFQNIYAIFILNWQWFLLSLFICLSAAMLYLRYTEPVYSVTTRMLIKDDTNNRRNNNARMLANMQDLGFMTNSAGIDNEVEVIQSRVLIHDVVMDLKLHTSYRRAGRIARMQVYGTQPVTVELDSVGLDSFDILLMNEVRSIALVMTRNEGTYVVKGKLMSNGAEVEDIDKSFKQLPYYIDTRFGKLTFSANGKYEMDDDDRYFVSIVAPETKAIQYLNALTVAPTSKMTSVAQISVTDNDIKRGMDFLSQLAVCYNRQANADKNEIALRTEEFINDRIEKLNAELGTTEGSLEKYKKQNALTRIEMDATQSLTMSNQYATKLAEITSQIQLLDYLREFVDNPANNYKIIPSNVGMTDNSSTALITEYNKKVLDRNHLLRGSSEQAPQVMTITAALDDLQSSIRTALLQARRSADIQRQGVQNEYSKYQSRVGSTPEQERVLTEIGRQQEVKSGLYLMLLQKREENSISLAATADKGRLIDNPAYAGKVKPKSMIILLISLVLGFGIPLFVTFLLRFFSYRIEGRENLESLTTLPVIADVPVASESVKSAAGIVVQANKNNQIDEIFRSLRTNILFMMKEGEKVILFTSSTSGEGKTFLAANLAVSFALLGKRVVLCGADIRKPALGKLFNLKDRQQGLSTLLTKNTVTMEDVNEEITPSGVNPNLDILLAGPTPPNPTELLARQNLEDVIELLKQEYDYVILDTAPVGLVTDTLQIARHANVSCYVCRADYTPKSEIGIANSLAKQNQLPNVCMILNGVDMSKKKYGYYYGYGKYGKYGRYGYGRYGYGKYGRYGRYGYGGYGNYGNYGNYAESHYGNKNDNSIKR